ncbi:hypothetical protein NCGM1179_1893 [Pseudomonas aeruginosa NCMG1179]|nr:hypothetical protein NCGM1179_1893 [Pseudomonas aeruginosa NCMG1179]
MPRKAELNEPLLVQPPRHFFENLDAARVVFDQFIVSVKHMSNAPLHFKLEHWKQ